MPADARILTVQSLTSWSNRINNASQRFRILDQFNSEAVLDMETQLVWERSPSLTPYPWPQARLVCAQKAVGGRGGWRLPSFYELSSLVDPSVHTPGIPRLPAGHPFQTVQPSGYWSSTSFADEPGFALIVVFGFVSGSDSPIAVWDANKNGAPYLVWAVRGCSPGPEAY